MARISKRTVDAAKPGHKRAFVWDDRVLGFGVLVLPSGVRSYVYQYRTTEGRSRRATIGKVGSLAPAEARTLAEEMARTVKLGGDPLADKRAARDALTVAGLLDLYAASAHYATKADKVQRTGHGEIERHLKPLLGRRIVAKLGTDEVRRAFADIAAGKTAKTVKTGARGLARVRGGAGVARHTMRLLRAAFRWAITERLIERDPTSGINFGTDGVREATLDAGQYRTLFATLATMERERRLASAAADAMRTIALVGARRGEVTGLRWRDVDLKAGRVVLVKHKTARSSGKPRIITLAAAVQEIIARQPASGDADAFVFASKPGVPLQLSKMWAMVRREAGLPEGFGLHGLRHALASALAVEGAQVPELMVVLGHAQPSTVMRYTHFAADARARLAERAARVALAANGTAKATVVKLPKRGRP